jgi:hypothetical protein
MDKRANIERAILMADKGHSLLNNEILQLPSFSTHRIKHLLNNLGALSTVYGEVGVHKGGMTVAATYGNNLKSWVSDNWTLFEEGGLSKRLFYENMARFKVGCKVFEQDCFTIDLAQVPKTDFYVFDGAHDFESQKKGLTYFYPILADEFIFICDDYSWADPRKGTESAIKELNLEVLFQEELWDGQENGAWHNGIGVFLLKKTDNG